MYRNILRNFNFIVYLAIVVLATVVQSTIFSYFPLNYLQPDLALILAVYFGFNRDVFEGGVLVALGAIIMEAHSGAGKHYFLATDLYIFLVAKVLSRIIVAPNFLSTIGIVSGLTILKRLGILALLGMDGRASNGVRHFFIYLIPGILVQSLLAPQFFTWFKRIDLKTYKDEHAEDEYDINRT